MARHGAAKVCTPVQGGKARVGVLLRRARGPGLQRRIHPATLPGPMRKLWPLALLLAACTRPNPEPAAQPGPVATVPAKPQPQAIHLDLRGTFTDGTPLT